MNRITTVIVNYQTPKLLKKTVESFHNIYPSVEMILIDNGSGDKSPQLIKKWDDDQKIPLSAIYFDENRYHGPAMDYALKNLVDTKYAFLLDSDTETRKAGFLEAMMKEAEQNNLIYGVGEIIRVNRRGFKDEKGEAVLATPFMLLKTELYNRFSPFEHHGQPTLKNFREARNAGYELQNFPIQDYIYHEWRGTAGRYGYGLGWKGKINYILNKLGI